jgi:energy-coupling factor transporter transmembrane protein EcfT
MTNLFYIANFIILILVLIQISVLVFYKYIYTPHKLISTPSPLPELLIVLTTVINTELALYEKNVFNTKGTLTNANFENFYRDITNNVINSLSDNFFVKIGYYIKAEAVVSIICRTVKDFLIEKVNPNF